MQQQTQPETWPSKYIFKSWEDAQTRQEWELGLEFAVTLEQNITFCMAQGDLNPWYLNASPWGPPVVHPVLINQNGLRSQNNLFWTPVPPGQSSFHARTEAEYLQPILIGQKVQAFSRFPEKFIKRGAYWVVYETRMLDQDGKLLAWDRRTRYCGKVVQK